MDFKGFYDLNINQCAFKDPEKLFKRLVDFGYRIIAVNYVIDELTLETKSNKKRKSGSGGKNPSEHDIVPVPATINVPKDLAGKIQILNRLTIEFSDPNQLVKLRQSENIKKYHLLAAIPKTDSTLQKTLISLDFDIISFSPNERPIKLNRKMYNLAVSKNIFFEISYSLMLGSQSARRNVIQTAHGYHAIGKSKNVILTSGAENHMQIRGPYDIMNLGVLLGLSQGQVKNAVSRFGRAAVLKGYGRRNGSSVVVIKKINEECESEELSEDDISGSSTKRIKQISS